MKKSETNTKRITVPIYSLTLLYRIHIRGNVKRLSKKNLTKNTSNITYRLNYAKIRSSD